jgi:hypothetical protein
MIAVVFSFLLTLPAFGGIEARFETKTMEACRAVHRMVKVQLMVAGVSYTLTDCEKK